VLAYKVKMPSGEHRLLTPTAFKAYAATYLLVNGKEPEQEPVYTKPSDQVLSLLDLYRTVPPS
jgi:hypothetical protein